MSNNLRQIFLSILVGLFLLSPHASAQEPAAAACTTADFKGKFGFRITGTNVAMGLFVFIGLFNVDGAGHITGTGTQSLAGVIYHDTPFAGTYTVKADCSGTVTIDFGNGIPQHPVFVLTSDGDELFIADSDMGVIESGSAKRQFSRATGRDHLRTANGSEL